MRLAGEAMMAGAIEAMLGRDSSFMADNLVEERCPIIVLMIDNRKAFPSLMIDLIDATVASDPSSD